MRKEITARLAAAVVVLCLSLGLRPLLAEAPRIDYKTILSQNSLTTAQKKRISEFIRYWLGRLKQASDADQVLQGRYQILRAYGTVKKPFYQYDFAEIAAQQLVGIWKELSDDLKSLKEVNLAIIAANMPQITTQPVLEEMIVHANPAVRFQGWRGYRRIRDLLLAYPPGTDYGKKMYEAMRSRARLETSAPVLGMIFQMMQLRSVPQGVSRQEFVRFQRTAFEILKDTWDDRCRGILAGKSMLADAARKAVAALTNFAAVFSSDRSMQMAILQMIANTAYSSVSAFENSLEAIQKAGEDPKKRKEILEIRDNNSQLLRDCEGALNYITKKRQSRIARALAQIGGPAPGTVGTAVAEWIDELKASGVEDPAVVLAGKSVETR